MPHHIVVSQSSTLICDRWCGVLLCSDLSVLLNGDVLVGGEGGDCVVGDLSTGSMLLVGRLV